MADTAFETRASALLRFMIGLLAEGRHRILHTPPLTQPAKGERHD